MPTKGHHRSRSSIDRVIDLLADLEDTQIALLLDDLNHTTSSNVPVTDAIALFEHHASKPKRKSCRSPSPMRTLQVELERRHSKRMSSAPEPRPRLRTTVSQLLPAARLPPTAYLPPPAPPAPSLAPSPVPLLPPSPVPLLAPSPVSASAPALAPEKAIFDRPSLMLSPPPVPVEPRPRTSSAPSSRLRSHSYKRVSRPMFSPQLQLSPTATAELHLLLLAFFNETPVSPTTTATPSPTTPLFGFSHSPFSSDFEPEPRSPGLDLLEPSPVRAQTLSPGRRLRTMPSISSIFEGLRY